MDRGLWIGIVLSCGLALGCGDDGGSAAASAGSGGAAAGTAGAGGNGGAGGGAGGGDACSAALDEAIKPVDAVSTGEVKVFGTAGTTSTLYVDASAGGVMEQANNPWIYLSLKRAARAEMTDKAAFASTDWDIAIKRPLLRSNSGDGGPGAGGAVFLEGKAFADVTAEDAASAPIAAEDWFDDACAPRKDDAGSLRTTFSGWYDYDMATRLLTPRAGVFVVRGGDGALYKLAIIDYYATPEGGSGMAGGRYKLDVAPLP